MTFWSQSGLSALAGTESGGNPCAVFGNPNAPCGTPAVPGTGSGLYGFVDSTWNDFGGYASANLAPASVQTVKAAATDISNWTCPGCNPSAAALAADPNNVAENAVSAGAQASAATTGLGVSRLSFAPSGDTGIPTPTPVTGTAADAAAGGGPLSGFGVAGANTLPQLQQTSAAGASGPGLFGSSASGSTLAYWFTEIAIVVLALILVAMAIAPGGIKRAMAMAV